MIAAATRAGFEIEGTLRQAAWILGDFVDTVIMGFLAGNGRHDGRDLSAEPGGENAVFDATCDECVIELPLPTVEPTIWGHIAQRST